MGALSKTLKNTKIKLNSIDYCIHWAHLHGTLNAQ